VDSRLWTLQHAGQSPIRTFADFGKRARYGVNVAARCVDMFGNPAKKGPPAVRCRRVADHGGWHVAKAGPYLVRWKVGTP